MKKITLPVLAGMVLLVSCKKDYTCSCSNIHTETVQGSATVTTSSSNTTFKDVKKSFAEDKYECYKESNTYTYENWQQETVTVTDEWDCKLEK